MPQVNFTIPDVERTYYLHKLEELEDLVHALRTQIETGNYRSSAIGSHPAVVEPMGWIVGRAKRLLKIFEGDHQGWHWRDS